VEPPVVEPPVVEPPVVEPPVVEPEPVPICGTGTHLEKGLCVPDEKEKGGGCLIATAAFGSELAPQVQMLREIRDNTVLSTLSGTAFMTGFNEFYYSFSPTIADWERANPIFQDAVRITITPLLMSLSILNHVDIDSEEEMLGYGISLIILNLGMYFVAPAIVIVKLKKRFKHQ
ncbi:MAG: CFI-box-CTERM domain-containing protein, partial [Nitrosopumilaceae archaeon]